MDLSWISPELLLGQGVPDHGDARLNRRQRRLLLRLARAPAAPFPQALTDPAEEEGGYRFLRNERLTPQSILKPHQDDVLAWPVQGTLLHIQDSTTICHETARGAKDTYDLGLGKVGYLAHVSLLVEEQGGTPIGVARLEILDRPPKNEEAAPVAEAEEAYEEGEPPAPESMRWTRACFEVHDLLPQGQPLVHVMDSEGDIYELMSSLWLTEQHFVLRAGQDRRVKMAEMEPAQVLSKNVHRAPVFTEMAVPLATQNKDKRSPPKSKRNKDKRTSRVAKLEIRAIPVQLQRPKNRCPKGWPDQLDVALVQVIEVGAPAGETAVEWRLWTSLAVETVADVLRVVEIYRYRWLIEELFQALKTGCDFENRPLRSRKTSERALALYLPVANMLLRLRALGRSHPDLPAEEALPEGLLEPLRAVDPTFKRKRKPKVADAVEAVGRYGGHNRSDGDAGWRVLGRGFLALLWFAEGWHAGKAQAAKERGKGVRRRRR